METKVKCTKCTVPILESTFSKNGGLCTPCLRYSEERKRGLYKLKPLSTDYKPPIFSRSPTTRTKKSAANLSPIDMIRFPVWSFLYNEERHDETYVKPVDPSSAFEPYCHLIVLAEFESADSRKFIGTIDAYGEKDSFVYSFPEIFAIKGSIEISPNPPSDQGPHGLRDKQRFESMIEDSFGKPMPQMYPFKWKLLIPEEQQALVAAGEVFAPW